MLHGRIESRTNQAPNPSRQHLLHMNPSSKRPEVGVNTSYSTGSGSFPLTLLNPKFLRTEIDGDIFSDGAGDEDFFLNAGFSLGACSTGEGDRRRER
jgi:hypothetical protein